MTFARENRSQRFNRYPSCRRFFVSGARALLGAVMAWIFIVCGPSPACAGHLPRPLDAPLAMHNGTYKIDGNTVRITIEVAREQSFDGPASVACTLTGCETVAGANGKSESARHLTWRNTDRKPKTAVFTVPRDKFFAARKPIVISLNNPKGAKLGRTTSLVALPARAKWGSKALADAKGSLVLRVENKPNAAPAASSLENKALAEAAPPASAAAADSPSAL